MYFSPQLTNSKLILSQNNLVVENCKSNGYLISIIDCPLTEDEMVFRFKVLIKNSNEIQIGVVDKNTIISKKKKKNLNHFLF